MPGRTRKYTSEPNKYTGLTLQFECPLVDFVYPPFEHPPFVHPRPPLLTHYTACERPCANTLTHIPVSKRILGPLFWTLVAVV